MVLLHSCMVLLLSLMCCNLPCPMLHTLQSAVLQQRMRAGLSAQLALADCCPAAGVLLRCPQEGMVAISELPGALEGLGAEHLVGPGGEPLAPPREVCLAAC